MRFAISAMKMVSKAISRRAPEKVTQPPPNTVGGIIAPKIFQGRLAMCRNTANAPDPCK